MRMWSSTRQGNWLRSALKTALATAGYAAVHSLLASRAAKDTAARIFGVRARNTLYRPFFNVQALVGFVALIAYIRRQPGRTFYELRDPAAWLLRAAQAGSLVWAVSAAHQVGVGRMLGVRSLRVAMKGQREVPAEPEAQGPALDPHSGRMRITGPFRFSRHPLNLAPIPIFWLNPRMTSNLVAFAAMATLYFVVGSWHEEHRLRMAYGQAYEEYQTGLVRFLIPGRKVLADRHSPASDQFATRGPAVAAASSPVNQARNCSSVLCVQSM